MKIWLLIHHVSVQGTSDIAFLNRCANCNRCMRHPTVIGAPHGLDMTTLIVKIMNTLLHNQPGNLTGEVGLVHVTLLAMDVQCHGRSRCYSQQSLPWLLLAQLIACLR